MFKPRVIVEASRALPSLDRSDDFLPGFDVRPLPRTDTQDQFFTGPLTGAVLTGTLLGEAATACICDRDSDLCRFYKIGDIIDGARVASIESGLVCLEKEGIVQELTLLGNSRTRRVSSAHARQPSEDFFQSAHDRIFSRNELKQHAGQLTGLLTRLAIEPVPGNEPDTLQGYRLDKIPQGSLIDMAGIKDGDIIMSVQGRPIQSPADAVAAFNALKGRSSFEVGVIRDQQMVMLHYEITE